MGNAPIIEEAVPQNLIHREASWFELFFDLIFVTTIAGLVTGFGKHFNLKYGLETLFLFFIVWWLWLGHTYMSSRFYRDTAIQRSIGALMIFCVIAIAHGIGDAFASKKVWFTSGVVLFKLLLIVSLLLECRTDALKKFRLPYLAVYSIQCKIWIASVFVPAPYCFWMWGLALLIDLSSAFIFARSKHKVSIGNHHLPERFGLFTIVILGEIIAASAHGLDYLQNVTLKGATIAFVSALIGILFWQGYFTRSRGANPRTIESKKQLHDMWMWSHGHIAFYAGIIGLAAGTIYLISHEVVGAEQTSLYAYSAALGMMGITMISVGTPDSKTTVKTASLYLGVPIALVVMSGSISEPLWIVSMCCLACMTQIGLSLHFNK